MSQRWTAGETPANEKIKQMFIMHLTTVQRDALTTSQLFIGMKIYNITAGKYERLTQITPSVVWEDACKIVGMSSCTLGGTSSLADSAAGAYTASVLSQSSHRSLSGTAETVIASVTVTLSFSTNRVTASFHCLGGTGDSATITIRLKRDGIQLFSESYAVDPFGDVEHTAAHSASENNLAAGNHTWEVTAQRSAAGANGIDHLLEVLEDNFSDTHACILTDNHVCSQGTLGTGGISIKLDSGEAPDINLQHAVSVRKLSTTERDPLTTTEKNVGDIIWNTTTNQYERWTGTAWVRACQITGTASCALTGGPSLIIGASGQGNNLTTGAAPGAVQLQNNAEIETTTTSLSPSTPNRTVAACRMGISNSDSVARTFTSRLKRAGVVIASDSRSVASGATVAFTMRAVETDVAGGTYQVTCQKDAGAAGAGGSSLLIVHTHTISDTHSCTLNDTHKCG